MTILKKCAAALLLISNVNAVAHSNSTLTRQPENVLEFPAGDEAYHTYKETEALLRSLAGTYPDIASLFSIGKTTLGRDIWCLRLNTTEKDSQVSSKPGVFIIGNHHGREHLSNEVPLLSAEWLLSNIAQKPEIMKYLSTLDIYFVPMLNADGAEDDIKSGYYNLHRGNMRDNGNYIFGVDLNRNYSYIFGATGASLNAADGSYDDYAGPSPFSEPETAAVRDFVLARPNLKTMVSYHSFSSMILYPWAGDNSPVANNRDLSVFRTLAAKMASLTGYKAKQASSMGLASGEACDWAYATAGLYALTVELDGRWYYPGPDLIQISLRKNLKALLYLFEQTGSLPEASTKAHPLK